MILYYLLNFPIVIILAYIVFRIFILDYLYFSFNIFGEANNNSRIVYIILASFWCFTCCCIYFNLNEKMIQMRMPPMAEITEIHCQEASKLPPEFLP